MEPELACHVWWDESSGVAHTDWSRGSVCDVAGARRVTEAVRAFGHGPVPIMVDMRYLATADRAAREHFTSTDQATAVALLVASSVSKVVANFVIGLHRMPVPTRMFTDESAALGWLREIRVAPGDP